MPKSAKCMPNLRFAKKLVLLRSHPGVNLRAVLMRRLCEGFHAARTAERVFPVVHLESEPMLAGVRDVHDHPAHRVEHLLARKARRVAHALVDLVDADAGVRCAACR